MSDRPSPVVLEGPAPGTVGPRPRPVLAELWDLWRHRRLLAAFVENDLRYRYVGSSIGFFWTVVNPILELITYTFVFNVLMGVVFDPGRGRVHYSLFLFCGMVAWGAHQEGLARATTAVSENAHLIKKATFPSAILPAHVVLSAVVNQAVRLLILLVGVIFLGDGVSWPVLVLPAAMLIQCGFTLGLAFLFSTLHVYFKDTAHWVQALLLPWMFVTPIFYPPSAYPRQAALLLQLNPMAHIVGIYQELILNQRLPDPRQVLVATLLSGVVLMFGYSVFVHHRRRFADLT